MMTVKGWSAQRTYLAAGSTKGVFLAAVRAGHLDPEHLGPIDALVLRVFAVLWSWNPDASPRPANRSRQVPEWETAAVSSARDAAESQQLTPSSFLMVFGDRVHVEHAPARKGAAFQRLVLEAGPGVVVPIGQWWTRSTDCRMSCRQHCCRPWPDAPRTTSTPGCLHSSPATTCSIRTDSAI